MNAAVGRHSPTPTLSPVLTPPFFTSSPFSACPPPPLPNICLLFALWYSPTVSRPASFSLTLYSCSYWSLRLLFQLVLIHMLVTFILPSFLGKKEQKKTFSWPRCRRRITKVKMMTVHFNKVETYVSGNSTGLVLILLCNASMYSSMKGHCRKSRRKEVKTTRTHMHDDCCTGPISEKTTETNNSSNRPLGFITFNDSTRKLLFQNCAPTFFYAFKRRLVGQTSHLPFQRRSSRG